MDRRRTAAPLGLLCSAILATMVVFTATALGDSKNVTFPKPVMVAGVLLKAGTYRVEWSGTGPEVQVTFKKNGDTIATAPARLVSEKNPRRRTIETSTNPDDSSVLKRIAFSKEALIFDLSGTEGDSR